MCVRYHRGAAGAWNRSNISGKEFIREKKNPGETFPEGKTQFSDWSAFELKASRALILSDIHIPYHNKKALMLAIDYGRNRNPDTVILNGDTADFFSISRWETDPRQRSFKDELQTLRQFLEIVRGYFPKARIIFKLGNHEERWQSYMRIKAPEMLGVEDFELKELLRFKDHGVELVEDKRPIKLGELNIIHGHEYRFAISNPVNPARGLFLRCKAFAICGHFHQSSYHTEKTVEQSVIATWSTGCLADLHPEYLPLNNWSHGFAFAEVQSDGRFHMENKVIRAGRIY